MEITIDSIDDVDFNYSCDAYSVHVDNHRILTITTSSELTATKWLKNALKSQNTKLSSTLVVGLAADTEYIEYSKKGLNDTPYEILQLCIGSHCLLYFLPESNARYSYSYTPPKSLQKFFSDPRVMAIGVNIKAVAKKLERDFDIKIAGAVDINELAVKGMKREDLDLGRYDLDCLAKAVFGKHVYVERPEKKVEWYERKMQWYGGRWSRCYSQELSHEMTKFATVDPYLCFLIGSQLLDMIYCPDSSDGSKKMKRKKK